MRQLKSGLPWHIGVLAGALGLLTAACQTPPPQKDYAEITFKHRTPMQFDVASIVIEYLYKEPLSAPHVEHEMPVPPGRVAETWARDRLLAGGRSGRLVYRVLEASVIETNISGESSLSGLFSVEQSERYNARVRVEVELLDGAGISRARVETVAERSVTVPEDASVNEREAVWYRLTEQVMTDLDGETERSLRRYMADYILN